MAFALVAGNYYALQDPLGVLDTVVVNGTQVSTSTAVFVEDAGTMDVHIRSMGGDIDIITYAIVDDLDGNAERHLITLVAIPGGLSHGIDATRSDHTPGVATVVLNHSGSSSYADFTLWFSVIRITAIMPSNEIVRAVVVETTLPLDVTVVQNGTALSFSTSPISSLEVAVSTPCRFRIITASGIVYHTTDFHIIPRDESRSACDVSGTLFATAVSFESEFRLSPQTVVFQLRFETWVDDQHALEQALLGTFASVAYDITDRSWKTSSSPAPINPRPTADVLAASILTRIDDQRIMITTTGVPSLTYAESLSVATHVPASAIRSAHASVQMSTVTLEGKTVVPTPGAMRVVTSGGRVYTERDLWTEAARITLVISDDEWQDLASLTPTAVEAVGAHVRASVREVGSATAAGWNAIIDSVDIVLTTETVRSADGTAVESKLHIDLPQLSRDVFNLESAIEVRVDMPAMVLDDLPMRLSGQELANTVSFVLHPSYTTIFVNRVEVYENEVWAGNVEISVTLRDDYFLPGAFLPGTPGAASLSLSAAAAFRSAFGDGVFPGTDATWFVLVDDGTYQNVKLIIPQRQPRLFSVNSAAVVNLTLPAIVLDNGNDVAVPPLTFQPVAVSAHLTVPTSLTTDAVRIGFDASIVLTNDVWNDLAPVPVHMVSRAHASGAWNSTVRPRFAIAGAVLHITIPPAETYAIDASETVDVSIPPGATVNGRSIYVSNFSIQGSNLDARINHAYIQKLGALVANLTRLVTALSIIKRAVSVRALVDDQSHHFSESDSVVDRLRKLDGAGVDRPVAVCEPATIHGVPTTDALAFAHGIAEVLQMYASAAPSPPTHILRPYIPSITPSPTSGPGVVHHTIVLGGGPTHLTMEVRDRNGGMLRATRIEHGDAFVVPFDASRHSLTVSGTGVITTSW